MANNSSAGNRNAKSTSFPHHIRSCATLAAVLSVLLTAGCEAILGAGIVHHDRSDPNHLLDRTSGDFVQMHIVESVGDAPVIFLEGSPELNLATSSASTRDTDIQGPSKMVSLGNLAKLPEPPDFKEPTSSEGSLSKNSSNPQPTPVADKFRLLSYGSMVLIAVVAVIIALEKYFRLPPTAGRPNESSNVNREEFQRRYHIEGLRQATTSFQYSAFFSVIGFALLGIAVVAVLAQDDPNRKAMLESYDSDLQKLDAQSSAVSMYLPKLLRYQIDCQKGQGQDMSVMLQMRAEQEALKLKLDSDQARLTELTQLRKSATVPLSSTTQSSQVENHLHVRDTAWPDVNDTGIDSDIADLFNYTASLIRSTHDLVQQSSPSRPEIQLPFDDIDGGMLTSQACQSLPEAKTYYGFTHRWRDCCNQLAHLYGKDNLNGKSHNLTFGTLDSCYTKMESIAQDAIRFVQVLSALQRWTSSESEFLSARNIEISENDRLDQLNREIGEVEAAENQCRSRAESVSMAIDAYTKNRAELAKAVNEREASRQQYLSQNQTSGVTLLKNASAATTAFAGSIVEVVSLLFFAQSNRARKMMAEFFDKFRDDDRERRSVEVAKQIGEKDLKDRTIASIARVFAGAPRGDLGPVENDTQTSP